MPGAYGNPNLYHVSAVAYVSYSSASEVVTLPVGTEAATLRATTKCWVKIGYPGESAIAAAPGAEKTWVQRLMTLEADETMDIAVPTSTDNKLVQIAVIRDSADGVLNITARKS